MSDTPQSDSRRWALIGKLATVIGLLLGVISIFTWLTAPRGRLVGYLSSASFSYPPNIDDVIASALQKEQQELMLLLAADGPSKLRDALVADPEFLAKRFQKRIQLSGIGDGAVLTLNIQNTGDSTLKNVQMRSYRSIRSAIVEREGKDPEVILSRLETRLPNVAGDVMIQRGDYLDLIEIGDMPPRSRARVRAWDDWPSTSDFVGGEPSITLSHDTGTGLVFKKEYDFPLSEWSRRQLRSYPLLIVLTITAILLSSWLILLKRRRAKSAG